VNEGTGRATGRSIAGVCDGHPPHDTMPDLLLLTVSVKVWRAPPHAALRPGCGRARCCRPAAGRPRVLWAPPWHGGVERPLAGGPPARSKPASARPRVRLGVQWADVLALSGDAADNVPGVAGVGTKTALALLQQFEDLEAVLGGAGEARVYLGA